MTASNGSPPGAPGSGRGRWRTAVALTVVVLTLSIFDVFALFLIPLGILLVGWPEERRTRWILVGGALFLLAVAAPGNGLLLASRGWALILSAAFLGATLARPGWGVTSRGLAAVGVAIGVGAVVLFGGGLAGELDDLVRGNFLTIGTMAAADLQARLPDATWPEDFPARLEQLANRVADLFPALLALQSLAALALASWWVRRLGRSENEAFTLGRLRDFRFNDQMIWLLIGGLVLVVLPFGSEATRIAWNVVGFMAALYVVRGFAVFVYLATGSRSLPTMVLGLIAFVVLYRVALTAALLMGVGDTWLDVRRRVATAKPA
jgi:hypothetical protein